MFTPGPWKKGYQLLDVTHEQQLIARIHCATQHPATEENAHDNARLVAAAPEMYEALKLIVARLSPIVHQLGVKKAYSELLAIESGNSIIRKIEGK